ncbi:MAG: PilZ domain-containing protein [Deltaproteobacteria bacterium]|nr:PilZ domain-containing protein [Deltaproteobacteria bacterium]
MHLRRSAASHALEVGNISLSGLWLRVPDDKLLRRFRMSEGLQLDLQSPDDPPTVGVTARVARIVFTGPPRTHGVGLEFGKLSGTTRAAVERLVAKAEARRPPPLPPDSLLPPPLPSNEPFLIADPEFRDAPGEESSEPG